MQIANSERPSIFFYLNLNFKLKMLDVITFQIFSTTEKYRSASFIWSHFLFMTFRVLKIDGARN